MIRINEAIAVARRSGKKVTRMDIARKLWADSSPESQNVCINNLCNGVTTRVEPEWVKIICEMTGVDSNYLFNTNPNGKSKPTDD